MVEQPPAPLVEVPVAELPSTIPHLAIEPLPPSDDEEAAERPLDVLPVMPPTDRQRRSPSPAAASIARRLSLYKLQPQALKTEKFSDIQLKPVVRDRQAQPQNAEQRDERAPQLKVRPAQLLHYVSALLLHSFALNRSRVRPELRVSSVSTSLFLCVLRNL